MKISIFCNSHKHCGLAQFLDNLPYIALPYLAPASMHSHLSIPIDIRPWEKFQFNLLPWQSWQPILQFNSPPMTIMTTTVQIAPFLDDLPCIALLSTFMHSHLSVPIGIRPWEKWSWQERALHCMGTFNSQRHLGPHFLYLVLGVVPFNTWLISSWEESHWCYKLSNWQCDQVFSLKMTTSTMWKIRAFAQHVTAFIFFFIPWDKSCVIWDNSRNSTQKMRTLQKKI